jgi:hypothetical protein
MTTDIIRTKTIGNLTKEGAEIKGRTSGSILHPKMKK